VPSGTGVPSLERATQSCGQMNARTVDRNFDQGIARLTTFIDVVIHPNPQLQLAAARDHARALSAKFLGQNAPTILEDPAELPGVLPWRKKDKYGHREAIGIRGTQEYQAMKEFADILIPARSP
jgi:hypothetical protein